MKIGRQSGTPAKPLVAVLTADAGFEAQARQTFGASDQIALRIISGKLPAVAGDFDIAGATVVVIDLDADQQDEMQALEKFMPRVGAWPPVVVVTQSFRENIARTLVQM